MVFPVSDHLRRGPKSNPLISVPNSLWFGPKGLEQLLPTSVGSKLGQSSNVAVVDGCASQDQSGHERFPEEAPGFVFGTEASGFGDAHRINGHIQPPKTFQLDVVLAKPSPKKSSISFPKKN